MKIILEGEQPRIEPIAHQYRQRYQEASKELDGQRHFLLLLVDMRSSGVKNEDQQHQQLSGVDSSQHHMSMPPKSPQHSHEAQFSWELCDTPPPNYRFTMRDIDPVQRGYAFAKDVLRPYDCGIRPRYNRTSASPSIATTDGRWIDLLQEIEAVQQESDDIFPVVSRAASASSLGSEITVSNAHNRVLSEDLEIEIVHYERTQCSMTSQVKGTDSPNLQAPSRSLVSSKEVLITETGPGTYQTSHTVYGGQLVFSHIMKPSISSQSGRYRAKAEFSIGNVSKKSTRKRKCKIRDERLSTLAGRVTGDESGKALARKFRQDASRWWKIVVNPNGHWTDP